MFGGMTALESCISSRMDDSGIALSNLEVSEHSGVRHVGTTVKLFAPDFDD